MSDYQEDSVLQVFKKYLEDLGYLVLCSSGKQQGLYRYYIGSFRKGPDLVAVKNDLLVVGECKKISSALFKEDSRGISDYNSLQYVLNNHNAQIEILESIPGNLSQLKRQLKFINACVIGSTTYSNCLDKLIDNRITVYKVDMKTQSVSVINN